LFVCGGAAADAVCAEAEVATKVTDVHASVTEALMTARRTGPRLVRPKHVRMIESIRIATLTKATGTLL